MEIDSISDSNVHHYFLRYNFDYNFHYLVVVDYCNCSIVDVDYLNIVNVDLFDGEYSVVEKTSIVNDLWNNVMEHFPMCYLMNS